MEDADLLIEVVPELKQRMPLDILYTDGGFGSPDADQVLSQHQVEQHQTGIRGKEPKPDKLNLTDLVFETDANGKPSRVICPQGQIGSVGLGIFTTTSLILTLLSVGVVLSMPTGAAGLGVSNKTVRASIGLSPTKNSCGPNGPSAIWHSYSKGPTLELPSKPRCAQLNMLSREISSR